MITLHLITWATMEVPPPKPKPSKAERRELQEKQRAAKSAGAAPGNKGAKPGGGGAGSGGGGGGGGSGGGGSGGGGAQAASSAPSASAKAAGGAAASGLRPNPTKAGESSDHQVGHFFSFSRQSPPDARAHNPSRLRADESLVHQGHGTGNRRQPRPSVCSLAGIQKAVRAESARQSYNDGAFLYATHDFDAAPRFSSQLISRSDVPSGSGPHTQGRSSPVHRRTGPQIRERLNSRSKRALRRNAPCIQGGGW